MKSIARISLWIVVRVKYSVSRCLYCAYILTVFLYEKPLCRHFYEIMPIVHSHWTKVFCCVIEKCCAFLQSRARASRICWTTPVCTGSEACHWYDSTARIHSWHGQINMIRRRAGFWSFTQSLMIWLFMERKQTEKVISDWSLGRLVGVHKFSLIG